MGNDKGKAKTNERVLQSFCEEVECLPQRQDEHGVIVDPQVHKKKKAMLKALSGCSKESGAMSILKPAYDAFPRNIETEVAMESIADVLHDLAPQDPVEGMLCSQIVALHAQGMRCLHRAEHQADMYCHVEGHTNMAFKLLRLKNETIETLTRYRRKGEQKVVVQHINVNDDAKAIIGNVNPIAEGGGYV